MSKWKKSNYFRPWAARRRSETLANAVPGVFSRFIGVIHRPDGESVSI
jgi:hypothetical protein